jgi:membrane protein DedA with SNARE-associated domain
MTLYASITQFPYLGMFALLLLGGMGLPIPEDATLILCGILMATAAVKPIPALVTVYTGLLIADLSLHFIGRKFGRQILTHRRFRKLITPKRLSELERKFNRWGIFIILVGRHLAGLRAQIFLVSGVLKMSLLKFFLADAFSSLITMALMIGAGYIGGNSLKVLRKDLSRIEHWGIVLLIAALIVYLFYRHLKIKTGKADHE